MIVKRIVVFDKQGRSAGFNRDWKQIIPSSYTFEVHSRYRGLSLNLDDFVIIHLSDFAADDGSGNLSSQLIEKLTAARCSFLIISGGEQKKFELADGRGYFRGQPVDIPIDTDFSRCLDRFLNAVVSSCAPQIAWHRIEPNALPESLIALYVYLSAICEGIEVPSNVMAEVLEDAMTEYRLIGGTNELLIAATLDELIDPRWINGFKDQIAESLSGI